MADMDRFGDVGPAEIQDESFTAARRGQSGLWTRSQTLQTLLERMVLKTQIDEAGSGDRYVFEQSGLVQSRPDAFGDVARIGFRLFCGSKCAVALKLREVWAIGKLHLAKRCGQILRSERGARDRS